VDGLMVRLSDEVGEKGGSWTRRNEFKSSLARLGLLNVNLHSIGSLAKSHTWYFIVRNIDQLGCSMPRLLNYLQESFVVDDDCYAPTALTDEQKVAQEGVQRTLRDGIDCIIARSTMLIDSEE